MLSPRAGKPVLETLEKKHAFHAPMPVCLSQLELHVSSSARTLTVHKHCEVGKNCLLASWAAPACSSALLLLHHKLEAVCWVQIAEVRKTSATALETFTRSTEAKSKV